MSKIWTNDALFTRLQRRGYGLGGGSPRDIGETDTPRDPEPFAPTGPIMQPTRFPATRDYDTDDNLYLEGPNHQMPLHEGNAPTPGDASGPGTHEADHVHTLSDVTYGREDPPLSHGSQWDQAYASDNQFEDTDVRLGQLLELGIVHGDASPNGLTGHAEFLAYSSPRSAAFAQTHGDLLIPTGLSPAGRPDTSSRQAITNPEVVNTQSGRDVFEAHACLEKGDRLRNVPVRPCLERSTLFSESAVHARRVNSRCLGNIPNRLTRTQCGFAAPASAFAAVNTDVRAPGSHFQVSQGIVEPVPVNMMHNLIRAQRTPQMHSHNVAMLVDPTAVDRDLLVDFASLADKSSGAFLAPHTAQRNETDTQVNNAPWVAVDLDNTILEPPDPSTYNQGDVQPELGAPKPGAVEALTELASLGWRISIYTARFGHEETPDEVVARWAEEIATHLDELGVPFTDIWVGRKPQCDYFVDDKAIKFDGDWPDVLSQLTQERSPARAQEDDGTVLDVEGAAGPLSYPADANDFSDPLGDQANRDVTRPPAFEEALYG